MSDEADAEFLASGKKSSVSSRIQRPAAPTATDATAPSDSTASASASAPPDTTDSTNTTAASSSAEASATADCSASPPASSSLLSTLSREWGHLQDYMRKFQRPDTATHTRAKRSVDDILTRGPTILPSTLKPAGQAEEASEAEAKADAAEGVEAAVSGEAVGSGELVLVDSDTVWDKRMERMRHSFTASAAFLTFRKAKRTLIHSNNPILKPIHSLHDNVRATLDDIRLTWETSQHPAVYKMRDVTDRLVGETEMAFAIGEIMKVDPSFDLLSFHREMEEYMIPVVITAYLRGTPADALMLKQCSEGLAANAIWRSLRERDAKGERYDDTLLDISHVELSKAVMVKDTPVVELTFMVQQINCVRRVKRAGQQQPQQAETAGATAVGGAEAEGEAEGSGAEGENAVVRGSPSDIAQHFYVWILRRDFENPDFDWKIMEMQTQQVFSLV